MKSLLVSALSIFLLCTHVHGQEQTTLYYNEDGKGLDTKKKAEFYRVVTFDKGNNPVGQVNDFYMNGKPLASGEASIIDKYDNHNSRWKGEVSTYNEKGKLSGKNNYDSNGLLDGIQIKYNEDEVKTQEMEYLHGNPAKDYYLVYDKKGNVSHYSYLLRLPMNLATTDRNIVPITAKKVIYQDGQPVQFYLVDGLSVAVKLSTKQLYGNYYEAYITIENGSSPEFDFDPSYITASIEKGGEVESAEVLTYDEYMKKVKRRQGWAAGFSAFAEVAAATSAGYSSTTTSVYAHNSSGKSASVHATSTSYDGAAAYAASQNAANNIGQLANQQFDIKKTISEGYLKRNTVFQNSRVVGFINIKYSDADHMLLNVPVNGKVYHFEL